MSKAGTFTIRVDHSRNQETITVVSSGIVGGVPVNTIRSKVTYSSRTPNTSPAVYWDGILARAMSQVS